MMSTALLLALAAFMLALVHALVMEGWRSAIGSGVRSEKAIGDHDSQLPSISVIVPARNAADTIAALLQDLYAQDLPRDRYEVIVADDHSTDGTDAIVERMQKSWSGLRSIKLQDEIGKKAAIMRAAEEAYHDVIVITDADSRCGRSRLSTIAAHWAEARPDMLLMPVGTIATEGMLGWLQRKEQIALQAVTAGSALMGVPILANGANMAFSRSTFFQLNGFRNDRFASGDDMFLLQRMRRSGKRIGYLLDPEVVVRVEPESTMKAAWQQRVRWAGKMRAYRDPMMLFGSIVALLLPWILAIISIKVFRQIEVGEGLANATALIVCACLFWAVPIVRLVHAMEMFFASSSEIPVREGAAAWLSTIPALIAFMIYSPIIAIVSIFVRPMWKGRRIR